MKPDLHVMPAVSSKQSSEIAPAHEQLSSQAKSVARQKPTETTCRRYVIVLDFGHPENPFHPDTLNSSIAEIGDYVIQEYGLDENAVVLAEEHTYRYLEVLMNPRWKAQFLEIPIYGQASSLLNLTQGGTYRVLQAAQQKILQLEQERTGNDMCAFEATLVAHQAHSPRASLQAKKLGLYVTVPDDLPNRFYRCAVQWWCRNKLLWRLHEFIGYPLLRLTGQI